MASFSAQGPSCPADWDAGVLWQPKSLLSGRLVIYAAFRAALLICLRSPHVKPQALHSVKRLAGALETW